MEKLFNGSYLQKTYPDKIELIKSSAENLELALAKELLKETAAFLKESGFTFLADISSADYKEYFEVIEKVNNTFTITIRENFGCPDSVEIVNPHFRDDVAFSYQVD